MTASELAAISSGQRKTLPIILFGSQDVKQSDMLREKSISPATAPKDSCKLTLAAA